jgi:post-segregation antitoxin (ccd killing protein)
LQDKLTDMTVDRDRLQARVRDLEIEIDAAGQQPAPADMSEQIERIWDEARERAVSEIIELVIPLQVATGTHAESVLQILPAVIRRWMDGGTDDAE